MSAVQLQLGEQRKATGCAKVAANKLRPFCYVKSTRPSCHSAIISVWKH